MSAFMLFAPAYRLPTRLAANELPYRPKSGDAPNLSSFGDAVWSAGMRDIETIDSELGLLLAIRNMAREAEGRTPNTARIDALLDERSSLLPPTPGESPASD
jgi:hypothetical protein